MVFRGDGVDGPSAWSTKERLSVTARSVPIDAALEGVRRVQFETTDMLRRAQGRALQTVGFGPDECPYRVIASGPFWLLRDYGKDSATQSVLIVAAPIKRPCIWDLAPSSSAIRYCLKEGLHVRLLEWLPASRTTGANGFAEYVQAIGECVVNISSERESRKPFLLGHSLGGTLAAIYGATASESVCGLVLIGAPLCFRPATSRFRDALVSLVPSDLDETEPCPGSLLTQMSALASPDTFVWSRLADAAMSVADPTAVETHARVERWALDEVPLPGKFVHQLIEWLYREDRFCRGELIMSTLIGPRSLSAPTLAIVNTADDIAPLQSVEPFVESVATQDARIIQYSGEIGVGLQHLGPLIGRQAHARLWPAIISWMDARRQGGGQIPFAKFCG